VCALTFAFADITSVLAPKGSFPGFWIFLYRVSPFTYLVGGLLGTGLANTEVNCADNEFLRVTAPGGQTCEQYFGNYIAQAGGYLLNPAATDCEFCSVRYTNDLLATFDIHYEDRWRNFGIMWAFIIFNIFAGVFLYWLVRVVSCLCCGPCAVESELC
jgi:ATP-binding cassette subfamily G (WHITE) protein 2 (PDR)